VSANTELIYLTIPSNQLKEIDVTNNNELTNFSYNDNPDLSNILTSTFSDYKISSDNKIVTAKISDIPAFLDEAVTNPLGSECLVRGDDVSCLDKGTLVTNDKLVIKKGTSSEIMNTYEVAVLGDVVPNGKIEFTDVVKLFRHFKEIAIIIDPAELAAGDIVTDKDNEILFTDVIKLFRYFKGIINEL
jgi:hypothetical protein